MRKLIPGITLAALLSSGYYMDKYNDLDSTEAAYSRPLSIVYRAPSYENGKLKKAKRFKSVFRYNNLDSIGFFPFIDANLVRMFDEQEHYLRHKKNIRYKIGKLTFDNQDLLSVIQTLKAYQFTFPVGLSSQFDFYQIRGQDNKGNVKFSAYYTPVVHASPTKNDGYQYAIFERPNLSELPSQEAILNGAFDNKWKVIGYVKSFEEVKKLQLEGSGILEFRNGQTKFIAYHSSEHISKNEDSEPEELLISEENVEDSLATDETITLSEKESTEEDNVEQNNTENTNYPFFIEVKQHKTSTTGLALSPWYSIAVDKHYLPLGSCLLAATPSVNDQQQLKNHALQFVLAQDTGEAIRGTGRVDWYVGSGEKAAKIASNIHHYGQLWLILPKKSKNPSLSSLTSKSKKTT